ncbi:hypothetical protein M5X08_22455 [Paenibacillus apiarius]|uniref:hypothetical protein n=1 Tax=Paenibacillus apiarius TaxID=46240 RepID=UPI0022849124|nr:hypothetical protein [Paenibacillus apiarius]
MSLIALQLFPGIGAIFGGAVFLGVIPIIIATGLARKWNCAFVEKLNLFKGKQWAWTLSLYSGFCVNIWITIQISIINGLSILHIIYIFLGLIIQATSLLPGVQKTISLMKNYLEKIGAH